MIEAKVSFLNELRQQMSDTLTVDQMERLENVCRSLLDGYLMEEIHDADGQADDLLDSYVAALQVGCRSPKTISRYIYIIRKVMEFAKVPTRRVTVYHLRSYLAAEKKRGISDSTLDGIRQVVTAYFNWLQRESLIEKNPTVNLGVIKVAKKEKKTFSEIDLMKLNRSCTNARDRAILHFLRSTGCRISEMTELNRDAINFEKLECTVHGKGNKERTVYLDDVAGLVLYEYLESRKDDCPALFVNRYRERIQPGGVRVMLNELAERAGVDHVHPHKFRRTLATDLSRHGMPIQEVARVLGHDKIDTTMKYVMLNDDDVKASYRRYA